MQCLHFYKDDDKQDDDEIEANKEGGTWEGRT